jgi:hypothetical protein
MPTLSDSTYTLKARVPLPNTTLTVNIHTVLTREFRIRLWLGKKLILLAALVLGCNVVFDSGQDG